MTIEPEVKKYKVIEILDQETKKLGVDFIFHYGFREFYPDGTTMGISTNEDWNKITVDTMFKTEMEKHYLTELKEAMHKPIHYVLRTRDQAINNFQHKLLTVNMSNSLIIYKKTDDLIRGYFFINHPNNYESLNFFINNLVLFNDIIISTDYIVSQDSSLLDELEPQKFHLFSEKTISEILNPKKDLVSNTILIFNNKEYSFTPKEIQLVEAIKFGGTIKDLAKRLHTVPRTAEWHLTNIKKKIGAFNKQDVITFAQIAKIKQLKI